MNPLAYLMGAAGLAVGLVLGGIVQEVRLGWAKDEAVAAETTKQEKICEGRIADIKVALADDALAKVDSANSAIANVKPTPTDQVALQAMCNADPNCRERAP